MNGSSDIGLALDSWLVLRLIILEGYFNWAVLERSEYNYSISPHKENVQMPPL